MTGKTQEAYYEAVMELFGSSPAQFADFERVWREGKFRAAYSVVHEATQALSLEPSERFKKADESFYWEYVA